MKKNILLLLSFCIVLLSCSKETDPSIPADKAPIYVVEKMGTLGTMLNDTQKDTITTMIVKGEINVADFRVMRDKMPNLSYLDLKDVKCEDDKIPAEGLRSDKFRSIVLPLSIKTIEEMAFTGNTTRGPLILPAGLKTIKQWAFANCKYLSGTLILPESLTSIGISAFADCKNISGNVTFPVSLKSLGSNVFEGCDKVAAFRFPQTAPIQYNAYMFPTDATIQVPSSAVATYKATKGWKDYKIVGY